MYLILRYGYAHKWVCTYVYKHFKTQRFLLRHAGTFTNNGLRLLTS